MLTSLDRVPWAELEHAYGTAEDVPGLLRCLLDPDPKTREKTIHELYGNVFHQGTRYPATPYVIPFLIELCASPEVPRRGDLLKYWGDLIAGYFNVQERPVWGDGERIHWHDGTEETDKEDSYAVALHEIYRESLQGYELLGDLLSDAEPGIRAGAAWVMACLPTCRALSIPRLEARLSVEPEGTVRASIAFALGELGGSKLLPALTMSDPSPAVRCMAACQLTRLNPHEPSFELLLPFLSDPIPEYDQVRGAGYSSTSDAAFSLLLLPPGPYLRAVGPLCDQLDRVEWYEVGTVLTALLATAFIRSDFPLLRVNDLQWQVVERLTEIPALWKGNNHGATLQAFGLPRDWIGCKRLVDGRKRS